MAGYIGKGVNIPTAKITEKRQSYTATADQTVFTVTGGYDGGFADVYLNGVKLVNGVDVDVLSGTGFTLTTGATAGDDVDFIGYNAFEVADTYTQAEIDDKDALLAPKADPSFTGKVGIGTSSPATTLTVTGSYANGLEIDRNGIDSTASARLFFDSSINTTALFNNSGNFVIATGATVGSSSGTERMRIDSSGNVGIGTSSPTQKLHVEGSVLIDAFQNGGGLYFREGYETTAQPSITVTDHSGSANDGLSINSWDGTSFKVQDSERMRIDSAGRVTMPYQPAFDAISSSASGGGGSGIISMTNIRLNRGGHWSGSRFTAPVTGIYQMNCTFLSNSGSKMRNDILVNGTPVYRTEESNSGDNFTTCTFNQAVYLNANDYIEFSSGSYTVYGTVYTYASGFLIG